MIYTWSLRYLLSLQVTRILYSVSSQTKYGNFTWTFFYTSVIRGDPSLRPWFDCILKIHHFVRKNSWNTCINRAKKVYCRIHHTPMTDYLEPVGVPLAFIYQHLENITNECVYSTLLVSIKGYVCIILKNWPGNPFNSSNFVCLSPTLRILGFPNNFGLCCSFWSPSFKAFQSIVRL